jgi:predicted Zn finger-like uncharacterized protein
VTIRQRLTDEAALKIQCPRCKVVYEIDDSKVSLTASYAGCPKCQFRLPLKSKKPERPYRIRCPKCDWEQKRTPSCRNCGIVFREYYGDESKIPWKEFRYAKSPKLQKQLLLAGLGAVGIYLILNAPSVPLPIGAYFGGLVLVAACIAGFIIVKREKPLSVLLSDAGISAYGKTIPWTHIKRVLRQRSSSGAVFMRYIEVIYSDPDSGKEKWLTLNDSVENFEELREEIEKRAPTGRTIPLIQRWLTVRPGENLLGAGLLCLILGFFIMALSLDSAESMGLTWLKGSVYGLIGGNLLILVGLFLFWKGFEKWRERSR